jgi:hypothetical protein
LLSAEECNIHGQMMCFYFSAGISNFAKSGLEIQLKKANHLVSLAKEAGGNMVLGDDDEEANDE